MAAKIHYELERLLSEESQPTVVILQEFAQYLAKIIIAPQKDQNTVRVRTTQVQNQFYINEFYMNLPIILEKIFPQHPHDFGWFTDYLLQKRERIEDHFAEVQTVWSEIVCVMTNLMDPIFERLTMVCMSPDVYLRTTHDRRSAKFPIEAIVPWHTIPLIQNRAFPELPALYHNLLSNMDAQKKALEQQCILLTPWEQFVIYFLRSLTSRTEYIQPFYNPALLKVVVHRSHRLAESAISDTRLDISRIQVIMFTKVFHYLLSKRYHEVYLDGRAACEACDIFVLAVEEFIMNPAIQDYQETIIAKNSRNIYGDINLFSTNQLEIVFIFVSLLQQPPYLFQESNRIQPGAPQRMQWIGDRDRNALLEMKRPLYKFMKALFQQAAKNTNPHQSEIKGISFRPNKVADVAKLWLQILQPWKMPSDFIEAAVNVGATDAQQQPGWYLFDEKDRLNINLFNKLSHPSIASLRGSFNFCYTEDESQRDRDRLMWEPYVKEMSVFYFDLFVDYIQAIIQQGIYTPDDAVILNDVFELFSVISEKQDLRDSMAMEQSGQDSPLLGDDKKFILDGLLTLDQFQSIRKSSSLTSEYQEFYRDDYERTQAFDDRFWSMVQKAYKKLRQYNYGNIIDPIGGKEESMKLNQDAMELIDSTEQQILKLQQEVKCVEQKYQGVDGGNLSKRLSFQSRPSTLIKDTKHRDWKQSESQFRQSIFNMPKEFSSGRLMSPSFQEREERKVLETQYPVQTKQGFSTKFRNRDQQQFSMGSQIEYNFDDIFDQQTGRDSKGKGQQPKQGDGGFTKTKLRSLSKHQVKQDLIRTSAFQGNQWDRVLGSDEYWILYFIFRQLAFLVDKARGIKHLRGQQPQCQSLRKFANIYICLKYIFWSIIIYYLFTFLVLSN